MSDRADAQLGYSVAGAGDVNGDGFDDVIVGSPWFEIAENVSGIALVYQGGPAGIADGDPDSADARLESDGDPLPQPMGFGWSVA